MFLQSSVIRMFSSKNDTPIKIFLGKGQGKGGYSDVFLKIKLKKKTWERAGQGRIFRFVSQNKIHKKHSLGKGRAREDIQTLV